MFHRYTSILHLLTQNYFPWRWGRGDEIKNILPASIIHVDATYQMLFDTAAREKKMLTDDVRRRTPSHNNSLVI